jgi:hypothetical protein
MHTLLYPFAQLLALLSKIWLPAVPLVLSRACSLAPFACVPGAS